MRTPGAGARSSLLGIGGRTDRARYPRLCATSARAVQSGCVSRCRTPIIGDVHVSTDVGDRSVRIVQFDGCVDPGAKVPFGGPVEVGEHPVPKRSRCLIRSPARVALFIRCPISFGVFCSFAPVILAGTICGRVGTTSCSQPIAPPVGHKGDPARTRHR